VLEGGRFVSASVQGQKLTDSKIELEPSKAKIVENRHELNCYPDQADFRGWLRSLRGNDARKWERNRRPCQGIAPPRYCSEAEIVDVAAAIEQKRYFPLDIPDGFQTFQFAEHLATDAVKAARERNLRVGVG